MMSARHLAQANRQIAQLEADIARQIALIGHLTQGGRRPGHAEELLATMRQSLATMREHRVLVLADIASRKGLGVE